MFAQRKNPYCELLRFVLANIQKLLLISNYIYISYVFKNKNNNLVNNTITNKQ